MTYVNVMIMFTFFWDGCWTLLSSPALRRKRGVWRLLSSARTTRALRSCAIVNTTWFLCFPTPLVTLGKRKPIVLVLLMHNSVSCGFLPLSFRFLISSTNICVCSVALFAVQDWIKALFLLIYLRAVAHSFYSFFGERNIFPRCKGYSRRLKNVVLQWIRESWHIRG